MIYIFLAEGFEEIEALCPLDLMRRAGLAVTTVGIGGKNITGSHNITVTADITDNEYDGSDAQMIFLPGGMPGTINLSESDTVKKAIGDAIKNDIFISAICAAPSILGDMGLLNGKEAICYPGFEDRLKGAVISEKRVVRDGKIITAAGMGVAMDLGLEIVALFCGAQKAVSLKKSVIYD